MSDGEDKGHVWPPPPVREESGVWEEPTAPRVTDRAIGWVALGLSGLGSLCALLCVLSSVLDPRDHWFGLWEALQGGAVAGFVAGLFVGFVGWYSWEGKVGLGLAVTSPLWLVAALLIAAAHSR